MELAQATALPVRSAGPAKFNAHAATEELILFCAWNQLSTTIRCTQPRRYTSWLPI